MGVDIKKLEDKFKLVVYGGNFVSKFQKFIKQKEEIMKTRISEIPDIHWEILSYSNNHTKDEAMAKYPNHKNFIDSIKWANGVSGW